MKKQAGYILVLTMIMMAALSAIVVYVCNRGMTAIPLLGLTIEREKAKMLAFSGIEVARSQIVAIHDTGTSDQKSQPATSSQQADDGQLAKSDGKGAQKPTHDQQFLQALLPVVGRWSTYVLKESVDGVDGMLKICITCEDGKINVNKIFDFKTHKFIGEGATTGSWKIMLESLLKNVSTATKTADLFAALEPFLKAQKGPLEDVTQLLTVPAFAVFLDKLYVQSPVDPTKDMAPPAIVLTDLFTLYGNTAALEPWCLSTSVQMACGITVNASTVQQRQKEVVQWTKNFKPSAQWRLDWNLSLKNIYQKEFNALPKGLDSFFAAQFKPAFFGVLAEGTVGNVTQKVYAIIERTRRSHNNQIVYDSMVRKWYIV